jgi:hypothetical protein
MNIQFAILYTFSIFFKGGGGQWLKKNFNNFKLFMRIYFYRNGKITIYDIFENCVMEAICY